MITLGWVCLDGTNSWETNSSLGANLIIRQPLLQRFLDMGGTVHWYGLREESQEIEGRVYERLIPNPSVKRLVNDVVRDRQKKWQEKSTQEGSMSRWVIGTALDEILKYFEHNPLPKIDFLFAEYMDNGPAQIAYFSAILLHYAKRNVPIYVRDTERRFRYNSELRELFDETRETMYSHRLGRYVYEDKLETLHGQIRMVYPFHAEWDDGTNGFYRTPPVYMPIIYDDRRELPLARLKDKNYPVLYVGNDNNRREMFEHWYGGLEHESYIYGNWRKRRGGEQYVEEWKQRNSKVTFSQDPLPMKIVLHMLQRGFASVVVYPKHYVTLGQITDRMAELAQAGIMPIAPSELWNAKEWTLDQFIVADIQKMNEQIDMIRGLSQSQYDEAVWEVRRLLASQFDADFVFNDLCVALMKDGIKIWR